MSYFSSCIPKIAPFMKMPRDASTKIKILMKIHKIATLNSPWERPQNIDLYWALQSVPTEKSEVPHLIPFPSPSPQTPEFLHSNSHILKTILL